MIELIVGGARSGKSALAERRAYESGLPVTCVVSAQARDAEMAARIVHHRQRRPADWRVCEEPIHLADVLHREAGSGICVVVDCLTLWLTNLLCVHNPDVAMHGEAELDTTMLRTETRHLLDVLPGLPGHVILVSNEVGLGVVPMGSLSRVFVDEQGRLNQQVAQIAQRVTLVAAGLPLVLKS